MKIYLDTCCYGRPFDEARQSQERVETEAEIIGDVAGLCKALGFPVLGSATLINEINDITDDEKRACVQGLYYCVVSYHIKKTDDITRRAQELKELGLKRGDPYHVAYAEAAEVDFLLTADTKLERAASKLNLNVAVISPINFLPEVERWRQLLT